ALAVARGRPFADVAALVDWHDLMLFVLAHPASRGEVVRANLELARVARAARAIALRGRAADRRALEHTGIAWTTVRASFGLAIARWLLARWPGAASLDSIDGDGALADVLATALPPLQADVAGGGHLDADEIVAAFAGDGDRAAWLVRTADALPAAEAVREHLYETLGSTLAVSPRASALARTFNRGPAHAPYLVGALVRDVDVRAATGVPLPRARPPTLAQREAIVDASRATLAMLGRETDALSATSARDTAWHRLGRGVAIALHAPSAGRRGPLDAHVGFVLYRNGVPVAYGGGWPFLGGCRIGVNVFPAFRGGESAWLFAQVLRAYRQRFRIVRFVVEPSQYGRGSREGLVSGAFWFYWRLGFRPVVPRLLALAEAEAAKIAADRRYRAPIAVLRRFTEGDVALALEDAAVPPDPADLAEAASGWLAARGGGDPARAERRALALATRYVGVTLPTDPVERTAWRAWAPLLAQCPAIATWPDGARAGVAAVIRAKARDEYAFQAGLCAHRRLADALSRLARDVAARGVC
ncbi:MAG TPA: hypothetical protein VFQ55_04360, partial [Casimicrobiaceae bacterium]|nr:hypothetical protein [Casimicrobiaceae bacterium]